MKSILKLRNRCKLLFVMGFFIAVYWVNLCMQPAEVCEVVCNHGNNISNYGNAIGDGAKTTEKELGKQKEKVILKEKAEYQERMNAIIKKYSVLNVDKFLKLLRQKASADKTIYIASADSGYIDMAINLYETSIQEFCITNFLFICSDEKAVQVLNSYGADAIMLFNDTNNARASRYNTKDFGLKNIYKTIAIAIALIHGFSVVIMDVDIVMFKSPTCHMKCTNCEMLFLSDLNRDLNGGFYMSFPTHKTISVHLNLIENYSCWKYKQQKCLNILIKKHKVSVQRLDMDLFQHGFQYFTKGNRMFAGDNPSDNCVLVHNTGIVTMERKRYRFKENLLWTVDTNGYYSDLNAKYIMYDNLYHIGEDNTLTLEKKALKNAFIIGHLLKRIVILPKFFCYFCKDYFVRCPPGSNTSKPLCAAHVHFDIRQLDRQFENKYREHVFLEHSKVPQKVKTSISQSIYLVPAKNYSLKYPTGVAAHEAEAFKSNSATGVTKEEFLEWMKPYSKYSVIKFHSLYGNIFNDSSYSDLEAKLTKGILMAGKKEFSKREDRWNDFLDYAVRFKIVQMLFL